MWNKNDKVIVIKILSKEFWNWLKGTLVCSLFEHKSSGWVFKYWTINHKHGNMVKVCERCGKLLEGAEEIEDDNSV